MLDAYLLKNSLLTTSFNKYFQPSLLNKNTKVKLLYSAVKLGLKDLWVRKYESPQIERYRWLFPFSIPVTQTKEVMIIPMKYLSLKTLFCGEKILFYFIHKTKLIFLLLLTTNSALDVLWM